MRACGRRVDGPFLWQLYEYRLSADTNSICCLSQAVKLHPKLNLHVMYRNSVNTDGQDEDENFHCIDTVRAADFSTNSTLPVKFERVFTHIHYLSMLCTHTSLCVFSYLCPKCHYLAHTHQEQTSIQPAQLDVCPLCLFCSSTHSIIYSVYTLAGHVHAYVMVYSFEDT